MTPTRLLYAAALTVLAGCAQLANAPMNTAGDRYLECLNAAAERNIGNPTTAENIAEAAHAACWSHWTAYRDAVETNYYAKGRTAEEMQLLHDKTDAHLRQFELDARKAVMSRVVERTYGVKKSAP